MKVYLFKMLHGFVTNIGMTYTENDSTGIHFSAARIYKSLPGHLKRKQALEGNFDRVRVIEKFKKQLDNFLTTQPDQPITLGLTRAAKTNSIVDQVI